MPITWEDLARRTDKEALAKLKAETAPDAPPSTEQLVAVLGPDFITHTHLVAEKTSDGVISFLSAQDRENEITVIMTHCGSSECEYLCPHIIERIVSKRHLTEETLLNFSQAAARTKSGIKVEFLQHDTIVYLRYSSAPSS